MNGPVWTALFVGICIGFPLGGCTLVWIVMRGPSTRGLPPSFQVPTAREVRRAKRMRADLRSNIIRRA